MVTQEQMAVTSNNLANVNNPSYAEEQLQVETAIPLETQAGEEGTGVDPGSITELRNSLLDGQIQSENSVTGSLTAQQSALQNTQAYLDEEISSTSSSATPDSPNGLTDDMANMFAAFTGLEADPTSTSLQQVAVASAQQVSNQFTSVSSQLATLNGDLNTSVQNDTTSANQYLTSIASLNGQIVQAQASGGTSVTLVDQREQDLESLSNLTNFSTSTQSNGAVDVSIGGVTMVSGQTNTDSLEAYDPGNGQLQIKAQNAGTPLTLTGGSIAGEINVRDGAMASLQSGLNTLASQMITQVNSIYSTGYDASGNTGQNFFSGTDATDIGVNPSLVSDPSQFQTSGTAGDGDNTIVVAMAALGNQSISGLGNQTFSANYADTVANLGIAVSSVNQNLSDSQAVSQSLTSERASAGGVSLDAEMTNLLQYQKAYEASAELITSVDEMLQTLIAMPTT
jgi:flagellar hook-associated protein 1 FlgK